ncbi:MAG TPA: MASE1 domain-containing protein [Caulobacteraceae bacterium]|jgi:PAS domain S-box-containing protein
MLRGRFAWMAFPAELAAIAFAYWLAATLSLRFASINPSATPIWPPTGLALGLMLLRGYRIWPAILAGAIAANVQTSGWISLAIGVGNTLEALAGAWLVNVLAGGVTAFRNPVGVVKFAAVICVLATPISATMGVLALTLGGHVAPSSLLAVWTTWWLGDLAGGLLMTPALVLWATDPPRLVEPYQPLAETILVVMLSVAVGLLAFGPAPRPFGAVALAFLAVLPLLWGALRGSERDTITAAVILSGFAIWGTAAGSGPFILPTLNGSFLLLVAFMVAAALASLALSSAIGARGRALVETEKDYRLLVGAIRDYAIFMIDPAGQITTWNSGAARIYGYAAADIIGRPLTKLAPTDDPADLMAHLRQAAETGAAEFEAWRVRQDGSRFRAHVLVSSVRDDHARLIGFAKITRDISQQQEAQLALERTREQLLQSQKLEALGQLTGGVAHDFNNLLMVFSGQADILSRGLRDSAQLKSLDAIKAAVARGSSLTQQLLSFARRQTLMPEVIDLARTLGAMRGVLKSSLGEAIALELDLDQTVWPIEVDVHLLELAILNLTVNARDAMPDGGNFRIGIRNFVPAGCDFPGEFVDISVSDTGVGMTPEVLAKAFDPFFTTKPTGKGTGLGLSQVHGFAVQSGGNLSAVSRPGEGCSVVLRLPRAARPIEVEPKSRARGQAAAAGRVLLVEDNPDVAKVTTAMLRSLGCSVVAAADGVDALRRLDQGERFDMVLSDIVMPGPVDGLNLAGRLRAQYPNLPVVLATGYSQTTEAPRGVAILRKPFNLDLLSVALDGALSPSASVKATNAQ